MQIEIVTIFPELFPPYLNESLLKRAQAKGLIDFNIHNLRDYTTDKHQTVDERPYGGGPGMILRADVIIKCLQAIREQGTGNEEQKRIRSKSLKPKTYNPATRTIVLDPAGKQLDQKMARRLAKYDKLVLLCGRYEGFDERVYKFVDEKISIGSYVLAGGELPALVLIDTVSRMIPGVVGHPDSIKDETHTTEGYIEYPQYTRPEILDIREQGVRSRELAVPKVLLSGNHKKIAEWRIKHSKNR